jgi:hypothetical protein
MDFISIFLKILPEKLPKKEMVSEKKKIFKSMKLKKKIVTFFVSKK